MTDFGTLPTGTLPGARATATRQLLEREVSRSHRSRRPLFIAAGAVVLAAGASAAGFAYTAHSAPVTDKYTGRCYTVASLSDGSGSYMGFSEANRPGEPSAKLDVNGDLTTCAGNWRWGFLRPGPHGAEGTGKTYPNSTMINLAGNDPYGNHPVPPLVACVLSDGTAAVFPGNHGTCAALHLANAAAVPAPRKSSGSMVAQPASGTGGGG